MDYQADMPGNDSGHACFKLLITCCVQVAHDSY